MLFAVHMPRGVGGGGRGYFAPSYQKWQTVRFRAGVCSLVDKEQSVGDSQEVVKLMRITHNCLNQWKLGAPIAVGR